MIAPLYKGSVKDLLGPAQAVSAAGYQDSVVFQYTDAYSVFDWGRMPDSLENKGAALAILAAEWFERLETPERWKEFSKSPTALALRKSSRFGAIFNEIGEQMQTDGLRTHYLGVIEKLPTSGTRVEPHRLSGVQEPVRHLAVRRVSVVKPTLSTVMGRALPDYLPTRNSPAPRLVPLEVVFRFGCPEGSSLLERVERDPGYLASLGFGDYRVTPGVKWDFPVLEVFTKLESTDRPLTLTEALAISGLTADQLQEVLLKTAWVAGFIKGICANSGLELADGKLEWGIDERGGIFLVDAIGPDELRILKDGIQLSKEFLRIFYRGTSWYAETNKAKQQAKAQGIADWKRLVSEAPPNLPVGQPGQKELASQLYMALANELTGRQWFKQAWSLGKVIEGIRALT